MQIAATSRSPQDTKRNLLDAAIVLMRQSGFNATSVDDICRQAGVTKGGFFHYFKTKEDLAAAALTRFRDLKEEQFADAPFRRLGDPLERVFGRLDFVRESALETQGSGKGWGCLIGMFAQELSFTNPQLRALCQEQFAWIAQDFERDLAAAKVLHAPGAGFDPKSVALLYVAVMQGSLITAKAAKNKQSVADNIEHFRSYVESLFGRKENNATGVS